MVPPGPGDWFRISTPIAPLRSPVAVPKVLFGVITPMFVITPPPTWTHCCPNVLSPRHTNRNATENVFVKFIVLLLALKQLNWFHNRSKSLALPVRETHQQPAGRSLHSRIPHQGSDALRFDLGR